MASLGYSEIEASLGYMDRETVRSQDGTDVKENVRVAKELDLA